MSRHKVRSRFHMCEKMSDYFRHLFRKISNVRPLKWLLLYIEIIPLFALIYWLLPDGQFRIPDAAGTDYGSWLYYSIVTITTLGFGDYTPAHGWAQAVTAVEVMCGLSIFGFFLNSVGSLKSEIDVSAEVERQRMLHKAAETDKLLSRIPSLTHVLAVFIATCDTLTALSPRSGDNVVDGVDEKTVKREEEKLYRSAFNTSLALDSLQSCVDLTLWPGLLESCFAFVANAQMYASDRAAEKINAPTFISDNLPIAQKLLASLSGIQGETSNS